jgi:hypothetical protein
LSEAQQIGVIKKIDIPDLLLNDTTPSGTLNMLRKIRIGTAQTITIPDEATICEFFIRNPDITLLIPRDLSRLSSISYSSIITISYNR